MQYRQVIGAARLLPIRILSITVLGASLLACSGSEDSARSDVPAMTDATVNHAVVRPDSSMTLKVNEGTNFSVIASPARDRIIINLQQFLWSLPMDGGPAQQLSDAFLEPAKLDWSPDGSQLVVQSYKDGMFHLYSLNPDGSGLTQLTEGDFDDLDPRWSFDGKRIAFVSERGGNRDIWTLELASGELRQITGPESEPHAQDVSAVAGLMGVPSWTADPAWSPDGSEIAFVRNMAIEVVHVNTGFTRPLVSGPQWGMAGPSWSPDGRYISYAVGGGLWIVPADGSGSPQRVGDKNDVFPYPAAWLGNDELLYSANGRIWVSKLSGETREIPFEVSIELKRPAYTRKVYDFDNTEPQPAKGLVGPKLSPDGSRIVFKALNDLWLMPVGGQAEKLTDDTYYEIDPEWSPDGSAIAYASDKAGSQDIYVLDLASGNERRVTSHEEAEVAPAWSPDSKFLAFLNQRGHVLLTELASGEVRTLLTGIGQPGRLSWSPDGETLLVSVLDNAKNRVLAIDMNSGERSLFDVAPGRSVSTRGDDGPLWSGDGTEILFSMGSTLWTLAMDGVEPAAAAQQISTEVSDSPSWSTDARQVLYLNNGRLRLLDRHSGQTRTLDTGLTWQSAKPEQQVVIHAGRLWNGVQEEIIENVDIHIVDNRIRAIRPHSADAARQQGVRFIDASQQTIVPGLFNMHNHQQFSSKFLGDRQGRAWLAYGVTSTRSTGDQVYRALEDKEALESGDRVGPRFFMSGELFEGKSLQWDFARPVESREQLELEIERAKELGFDVIKTYVRFPSDYLARLIEAAHLEMGISVTSHYFYPGVAFNQDGSEHGGGPTRWEMSTTWAGGTYDDVWQAMTRTGFEVTTTNFASAYGLVEDPSIVSDVRVQALYPLWERRSLEAKLKCAVGEGPCGFLPPNEAGSRASSERMARLHRAGATVMIGTDSPLDHYGISQQLNMRSLAKYGLSPFETLQSATIVPARAQGVARDLGSVEVGKVADLVIVDGDPSQNFDDLAKVKMVMKNGQLFSLEELIAPFN